MEKIYAMLAEFFASSGFKIMLTGSLLAVLCALLGCFLVLRKMSMVGDAISHAVLPGIVIAFLISGSSESVPMLIGAASFGILTTFLIETFNKSGRLQSDAAIGLTFTWLFAIGVILLTVFASQSHIDHECVLYGEIAYVGLDMLGPLPRAAWVIGGTLLAVIGLIIFGYRGLFLTSFDPAYAAAIGISVGLWHYILMGAVSLATVVSFESVGAILVVAFLVVPAATAHLLTDRLPAMLIIASLIGIASAIGGYYFAEWVNGSHAGAMTVMSGIYFTLAFLFAPKRGVLVKNFGKQGKPDILAKAEV